MKRFIVALLLSCSIFAIQAQSNFVGSGIAVSFDGTTGNVINLGDVHNDLNFPLTVEAWVYPEGWTPGGYSPIVATDVVGFGGSYYGFWFRFNSTGKLIFEIGDGSGSGGSDRRGKMTTSSVALNKWTHVTVVATSVSDIKFYFNGVLQTSVSTDGGGSNTTILHTTYPFNIGRQITPTTEHNFTGQIDEVRIWDIARTQTEIRDYMCSKITAIDTNLIGYYNFDESYVASTVADISTPAEEGLIAGDVLRITSGAAIGDESIYEYLADYAGVSILLNSPGGDKLRVNKIGNLPHGVHIYRVDAYPYSTEGLALTPNYYFGVFTADAGASAKYSVVYNYSFANGITNLDNEASGTIFNRLDGAASDWTLLPALISLPSQILIYKNKIGRGEFIYNIDEPNNGRNITSEISDLKLKVYPNPADNFINVEPVSKITPLFVTDINGRNVLDIKIADDSSVIVLDIQTLPSGVYFINQMSDNKMYSYKFIKK